MSRAEEPAELAHEGAGDEPGPEAHHLRGDLDGDGHLSARERFGVLREAAIEAEYATGRHEETEAEAKRNVILRMATIVVGFVVLLGGVAMMILPGPGILGIIAGLGILSRELVWAERMLDYAKEKARVDELKEQPRWMQVGAWAVTISAIGASLWYVLLADPKPELMPWNWD
jgi:uncharacterized protein (TIGR02611 family)